MAGLSDNVNFEPKEVSLDDLASMRGLRLDFRNAPLQSVLTYLHDAAQLTIEVEPNVEIQRRVDLWNAEPVDKEEALKLLRRTLEAAGYTAVRRGSALTVIRSQEAKKYYIPLPTVSCSA